MSSNNKHTEILNWIRSQNDENYLAGDYTPNEVVELILAYTSQPTATEDKSLPSSHEIKNVPIPKATGYNDGASQAVGIAMAHRQPDTFSPEYTLNEVKPAKGGAKWTDADIINAFERGTEEGWKDLDKQRSGIDFLKSLKQ